MTNVKPLVSGSSRWAEIRATRIVAEKYASEVDAIKTELMFAYAQGYQDGKRESQGGCNSIHKDGKQG